MPDESGEKSQEPTQHRRDQAREKGQVPYSQDLGSAASLLAGVLLLRWWGLPIVETAVRFMRHQLGTVTPLVVDGQGAIGQARELVTIFGKTVLPVVGLLAVSGVLISLMQVGVLWVPERLKPDLQRLSIFAGIKRIFSLSGAVKLGFGLFKVIVVAAVAATILFLRSDEVLGASGMDVGRLATFMVDVALSTALWVGIALLVLALFDFMYQKWKHEQDLRMTHQEVRDEMKNLQGDPQIIARRRAIQRQMALNRMGDKVPQADVIVTNPTELAIAIEYLPDQMHAPIVVAKGAGVVAQRIRRLGLEHNIPVVERKGLAQLLWKQVEVGHPVPDECYAAVAEVLAYVYQLQGKKIPIPPQAAA